MATARQIRLLQHSLGLSESHRTPYRNHFVAGEGHHDMPDLLALEEAGLMRRVRSPGFLPADDIVFCVTDPGKSLALDSLPPPLPEPKRSRYSEFLDADVGYGFSEFLCGERLPRFESSSEWKDGKWIELHRMYRLASGMLCCRDIEGDWCPTKKEAKASYKAALKGRHSAERAALAGGLA